MRRGRSGLAARALPALLAAAVLMAASLAAPGPAKARAESPPRVALTFDDGYNFDHRILEYLHSQGISASAFVIGAWAERNIALLQEMDALGWDVCNHTHTHPWLTRLADEQVAAELHACQAVIGAATGQHLPVFRPPGGFIDARVTGVAAAAGYAPVMWDFDSMDSRSTPLSVRERVQHMVAGAADGDIILFHFGGRDTLELVMGVVQGLQGRGFSLVTLSELYGWKSLVRGGESGPGIPGGAKRCYFAEGNTGPGFQEWLLLFNPGEEAVRARASFHSPRGKARREYVVPPGQRLSILVNDEVPWQDEVSIVLRSSGPLAAERALYFNRGGGNGGVSIAPGISEPSPRHYFSEGTVRPGFEEYLVAFNPSGLRSARVEVELHGAGGEVQEVALLLEPLSRMTLRVNDLVAEGDYAAEIRSALPLAAERAEYFARGDLGSGSHCVPGIARPSAGRYFAEGTTRDSFDGWLCLFNPCTYATRCEVAMFCADGRVVRESVALGAGERKTLHLNSYLPPGVDYSLALHSLLPVVAERTAYFRFRNAAGGYCSPGTDRPRESWLFAEGCTSGGFSQWLSLFNPSPQKRLVRVGYHAGEGEALWRDYELPAWGRMAVDVCAEAGEAQSLSMEVSCEGGIVAERSLYFGGHRL